MKIPAAKIYFPGEDRKELLKQIDEILASGQLTLGKYTKEFEERFAKYVCKYVCTNGDMPTTLDYSNYVEAITRI